MIFIDLKNGRFEFEFHHAHNHAYDDLLLLSKTRNLVEEICDEGYSWLEFQNKMQETDFQTKLNMLGDISRLDYSRFYYIQNNIEANKAYLDSDVVKVSSYGLIRSTKKKLLCLKRLIFLVLVLW